MVAWSPSRESRGTGGVVLMHVGDFGSRVDENGDAMRTRHALLVGSVVTVLLCVAIVVALWVPAGRGALAVVASSLPLRVVVTLFAAVGCALGASGLYRAILQFARDTAQLSASEDGSISIERAALVSVARRSLAGNRALRVESVDVQVVPRKGTTVLDVTVVATPRDSDALMTLAADIQRQTKQTLEAFTEHEVRYVAVNFVEDRRHADDAGATAKGAPATAVTKDAQTEVPAPDAAAQDAATPDAAPAEAADEPAGSAPVHVTGDASAAAPATTPEGTAAYETVREKRPSLISRLGRRVGRGGAEPAEVIVDTPAVEVTRQDGDEPADEAGDASRKEGEPPRTA